MAMELGGLQGGGAPALARVLALIDDAAAAGQASFRAAERLRAEDPEACDLLTRARARFQYRDAETFLQTSRPHVVLEPVDGEPRTPGREPVVRMPGFHNQAEGLAAV